MKEQRDTALKERAAALKEKEILSQLNTELVKTHKGIGEEVALKKDLRKTERERDAAKDRMRALSSERRFLGQNLQLAESERIEAECRVLSTAQYEQELMKADHDRELSAANKAWVSLLKRDLEELRLHNEDVAKRTSEETKLAMDEFRVSFMDTIRKLEKKEIEEDSIQPE